MVRLLGQSLREMAYFVSSFVLNFAVLTIPSFFVAIIISDGTLLDGFPNPSHIVILCELTLIYAVVSSFFVTVLIGFSRSGGVMGGCVAADEHLALGSNYQEDSKHV